MKDRFHKKIVLIPQDGTPDFRAYLVGESEQIGVAYIREGKGGKFIKVNFFNEYGKLLREALEQFDGEDKHTEKQT